MTFKEFYISDKNGKSNCVIRSLCKILNKEYNDIYNDLCKIAEDLKCDSFNDIPVFEKYMEGNSIFTIKKIIITWSQLLIILYMIKTLIV